MNKDFIRYDPRSYRDLHGFGHSTLFETSRLTPTKLHVPSTSGSVGVVVATYDMHLIRAYVVRDQVVTFQREILNSRA